MIHGPIPGAVFLSAQNLLLHDNNHFSIYDEENEVIRYYFNSESNLYQNKGQEKYKVREKRARNFKGIQLR
jgi:uncharacterized phage-like protein YoqJ